jgi:hypothetical protein
MSKTPHKRKAQVDGEDDVATEAQQRAQAAVVHASQAAAAPATTPSSLRPSQAMRSHAGPAGVSEAAASSPPAASLSSLAAQSQPSAALALAICPSSLPATEMRQTQSVVPASINGLADVEVQLVMQHLDRQSLLRLARCSRVLLRCASNSFVWRQVYIRINVHGSDVTEHPRLARSLLRFALSFVSVDQHASDPHSLVDCTTLSSVPQLASLVFQGSPQPLMQRNEWCMFLQHPSARRLQDVHIGEHSNLCDSVNVSLLSQLPLLRMLSLHLPAMTSASHLTPLANCPSLTEVNLFGPRDGSATIPAQLKPLGRCTRLRILGLHHLTLRVGQLSDLLIQLAQAGGQLQQLRLKNLSMLPMDDSVLDVARESADDAVSLELLVASRYLSHLRELTLSGAFSALDCVLCLPSLRMLILMPPLLPSALKLEFLLRRLPELHCIIHYGFSVDPAMQPQNEAMLPQLTQLAEQYPHLVLKESE